MDNNLAKISEYENDDEKFDVELGRLLNQVSQGVHMVNPKTCDRLMAVYQVMKAMFHDDRDVTVEYVIGEPYPSMGYVRVEGKSFRIIRPDLFTMCCKLSSCLDIYPLVKNAMRIEFTFNDISKKIGEVK